MGCSGQKTPETGKSGLGAHRPAAGNASCRLHRRGNLGVFTGGVADVPGVEGYPWDHRPQRGRWAVNPVIRVPAGNPLEGQILHILVFYVNKPSSDGCQILHGAATWCLLLPRTVKSSVGMLYGLFRIDLYSLSYVGAIDVVVWQSEVDLSDLERC